MRWHPGSRNFGSPKAKATADSTASSTPTRSPDTASVASDDTDVRTQWVRDTGQMEREPFNLLSFSDPLVADDRDVWWIVDARKLSGRHRVVVSPPFRLPQLPAAVFRLMITARGVGRDATFKNGQGAVTIQLKCESDLSQLMPTKLSFDLRAGNCCQSTDHDFTRSVLLEFPSELYPVQALDEARTCLVIRLSWLSTRVSDSTLDQDESLGGAPTVWRATCSTPQFSPTIVGAHSKLVNTETEPSEASSACAAAAPPPPPPSPPTPSPPPPFTAQTPFVVGPPPRAGASASETSCAFSAGTPYGLQAQGATVALSRAERRAQALSTSLRVSRTVGRVDVAWTIDANRLVRRNKVVVSPSFELPLLPSAATFKLLCTPTGPPTRTSKAACQARVELKCEDELKGCSCGELRCRLTLLGRTGEGDIVAHDFQASPMCTFPNDLHLRDAIDEELEVLLMQLTVFPLAAVRP